MWKLHEMIVILVTYVTLKDTLKPDPVLKEGMKNTKQILVFKSKRKFASSDS